MCTFDPIIQVRLIMTLNLTATSECITQVCVCNRYIDKKIIVIWLHPTSSVIWLSLYQPLCKLKTIGGRAFSYTAPKLWNSLPVSIRNVPLLGQFWALNKNLQYLFNQDFSCVCSYCILCFVIQIVTVLCKKATLQIQFIIIHRKCRSLSLCQPQL